MKFTAIIIIFLIIIFSSCLGCPDQGEVSEKTQAYFVKEAQKLVEQGKFYFLNQLATFQLKQHPGNYVAAYYKSYALNELKKISGLNFYIDYINRNDSVPDEYKEKWIELALKEGREVKIKNSNPFFSGTFYDEIEMEDYADTTYAKTTPKIVSDLNKYIYLDENGNLFIIKKLSEDIKKVNYYRTKDFALFNDYIIFNDSINLIKYNFVTNKYSQIYTFEQDKISIRSINVNKESCIIKHSEGDDELIKYIDLTTNQVLNLPNNCISQSPDFEYLVNLYPDRFDLFSITGSLIATLSGEFVGFSSDSSEVFSYADNYLNHYIIKDELIEKILFIKDIKQIKGYRPVGNNKILFYFDEYILFFNSATLNIDLIRGEVLHCFKTGFMYTVFENDDIYFFNFFDNSKNLLFSDDSLLETIVFPDDDSPLFLIRKDNTLQISNINDLML